MQKIILCALLASQIVSLRAMLKLPNLSPQTWIMLTISSGIGAILSIPLLESQIKDYDTRKRIVGGLHNKDIEPSASSLELATVYAKRAISPTLGALSWFCFYQYCAGKNCHPYFWGTTGAISGAVTLIINKFILPDFRKQKTSAQSRYQKCINRIVGLTESQNQAQQHRLSDCKQQGDQIIAEEQKTLAQEQKKIEDAQSFITRWQWAQWAGIGITSACALKTVHTLWPWIFQLPQSK